MITFNLNLFPKESRLWKNKISIGSRRLYVFVNELNRKLKLEATPSKYSFYTTQSFGEDLFFESNKNQRFRNLLKANLAFNSKNICNRLILNYFINFK